MNETVIEPGVVLGVLGGGQLGAMFAAAARRLGYHVAVWDPDASAPAHQWADHSFAHSFEDPDAFEQFTRLARCVTYEWENVPVGLCDRLEQCVPVRPSGRILRIIQDRIEQKSFLETEGFPVPAFRALTAPDQLPAAVAALGYPCICKTATAGYDGKGQWRISGPDDVKPVLAQLRSAARAGMRWIVEQFVDYDRELSLLAVRGLHGEVRLYPLVENLHQDGILRQTTVPAQVSPAVEEQADALAERFVSGVNGIGVFCVELFLLRSGGLLINEIAPRPHNSGHYTLDACTVSQFEQQARAIAGLPLGEVRLLSPAVMINLLGEEMERVSRQPGLAAFLTVPGAVMHCYGKRTVRAGRKMGHLTFLAPLRETAAARAESVRSALARQPAVASKPS